MGGQSKSEVLAPYNLREQEKPRGFGVRDAIQGMEECEKQIQALNRDLRELRTNR